MVIHSGKRCYVALEWYSGRWGFGVIALAGTWGFHFYLDIGQLSFQFEISGSTQENNG